MLIDCVRRFPAVADKPCQQLHTFRAIKSAMPAVELSAPHMGVVYADKDKPFFWSRRWHLSGYNPNDISFDFPALLVYEMQSESLNPFASKGATKQQTSVQLAVVDVYRDDCIGPECGVQPYCEGRTVGEIQQDAKRILVSGVFPFLAHALFAATTDNPTRRPLYTDFVDENDVLLPAMYIGQHLASGNKEVSVFPIEFPALKLYGQACNISVGVWDCEPIVFENIFPEYELSPANCNNC